MDSAVGDHSAAKIFSSRSTGSPAKVQCTLDDGADDHAAGRPLGDSLHDLQSGSVS